MSKPAKEQRAGGKGYEAGDKRARGGEKAKLGKDGKQAKNKPKFRPLRPPGTQGFSGQTGDPARDALLRHLAAQVKHYPRLDIRPMDLPEGLDPRDAALAFAINDAVVRRWTTLERLIAKSSRKPLSSSEPAVRGAMLAGAAQLMLLDRVPAYAAVNHAVEWVKLNINAGAAGLVNAVLNRLAGIAATPPGDLPPDWRVSRRVIPMSDGRGREFSLDILPEEDDRRFAVACGMPMPLYRSLVEHLGVEKAEHVCVHALANSPTVINAIYAAAPPADVRMEPHDDPGHYIFLGTREALVTLLTLQRDLWVQDAASSRVVRAMAGLNPTSILDLCAGQGTKTRQLAAAFPKASITATDIDGGRRATLREAFKGSQQVRVIEPEEVAALPPVSTVLLDVPCSNSGVLARRLEARHRFDEKSVGTLVTVQRDIIGQGVARLAETPGSALVYSTCSVDPRENEQQVAWAADTLGLKVIGAPTTNMPTGGPGLPAAAYRDGSFHAILTR